MNIGLTYDLRSEYLAMGYSEEETAEFDREETVDSLESALRECGHATDRIGNVFSLTKRLAAGARWDLVFNIAEGMHGFCRESQIPALLEAYEIPCTFSDAFTLAAALHKATAKLMVRNLGVPTPEFHVVKSETDIDGVRLPFPLFAKPMGEGTSKGIDEKSVVRSGAALRETCSRLLNRYCQPVLVETFLPGKECTVGIVGTGRMARAVGVLEVIAKENAHQEVYSYVNKEQCEELIEYRLMHGPQAEQAGRSALAVWQGLGCRDAGRVDFRSDERGTMHFLEINPLAGLHPTHSDLPITWGLTGRPYVQLIREILESATERVGANRASKQNPHPAGKGTMHRALL